MSGIPEPARPAPRRSRNTFEQAAQSLKGEDATPATQQPAMQKSVAQQAAPVSKKRKAATTDILLSLTEDLKDRMVATLEHTRPRTGITSQQQFIRSAIDQLCTRLETEFNNGETFPPPAQGINL
ncbi:hypothetical protein [Rhodococcus qingshengii]|uniref:hypothetical protein n=1 Tax=Rhodococcus qingshengii TaxID=334542 RepID=UPI001F364C99|nr:hypothetical protein [Rhodococcus qingshengii]